MRDQPVAGHQLLASVHARVTRFAAAADPQAVLAPDALVEVTALLELGAGGDTEVLLTAGRLRWCRFLAVGAGPGDLDRDAALRLFAQVGEGHPDIPAAAGQLLAAGLPPPAPIQTIEIPASAASDEAADLLERFERSADRASLERAITILDRIVKESPPISAEHARGLEMLSYALRLRYSQTGDRESLRRSVHTGRQAAALVSPQEPQFHQYLLNLIDALLTWYDLTTEGQHLAEAAAAAERLRVSVPDTHPDAGLIVAVLTQVLYHRFELSSDVEALAEAARLARECPPERLARQADGAVPLSALAVLLLRWSDRSADPADLTRAMAYCRAANEALPLTALVERAHVVINTSAVLVTAYERTGAAEHLAEAITICRAALADLPADSRFAPSLLTNLCLALRMQSQVSGDLATLDEAIEVGRRASAALPPGHRGRPVALSNLALAIIRRYQTTGDQALLAEANEIAERALAATPENHPEFFKVLTNLAGMTWQAGKRLGEPAAVLDLAVTRARSAVAAAPPGHHNRPGALTSLAVALRARFIRTGVNANIAEAVAHSREAVRLTPPGDLARRSRLNNLAVVLESHASRAGSLSVLREAVAVGRESLGSGTGPELPSDLAGLADLLLTLHQATDEVEPLDEAETLIRRALSLIPAGRLERVSPLNTLSGVLADRYEHTGAIGQLHEAITVAREAVATMPAEHPDRVFCLHFLARRLMKLHEVTGQPEVLSEAVGLARLAASVVPADHPYLVRSLVTISDMLLSRHQPAGSASDAATAVTLLRRALAAARPDDPIRGNVLTDLSIALRAQHDRDGGTEALAEAVTRAQEAMDGDDASPPGRLTALGLALLRRYDSEHRVDLLTQATHALGEAARQVPADDPRRAQSLYNLGLALRAEAIRVKRKRAAAKAITLFRDSAKTPTARPSTRVAAAQQWGLLAVACRDWQSAAAGFDLAVRTLPQVAPAHLGRLHRTDQLADFAGMAANATAVTLYAGDPERAVELMEQGRGVLLGQAIDLHTGLAELRRSDPASADRFTWLLTERDANKDEDSLDRRGTPLPPSGAGLGLPEPVVMQSHAAQRRHALSEEWGQLVEKIRARRGFRRFLVPASHRELLEHAMDGPIVILNVSQIRSDALVLTDAGLRTVHLPDARPEAVRRQANAFSEAVTALRAPDGDQDAADRAIDGVLRWLWDSVTGPVLDSLGYHDRPGLGEPWPRVWWSPTGMLSLLPLHAAGYHAERGSPRPPTVIDRVVSSYTPTVRALAHARRQLPAVPASPRGAPHLLVVSMPDTPGWPGGELPGAAVETRALRQLFPAATVLTGPAAGRDAVVAGLRAHPWVHFACHSRTDPQGIADSHLMLYDHERRPFTVADIARLDLAGAQFAFLSACDTARADQRLPDEAVHISSAFLLAGFASVVGTLWAIDDDQAVLVTRSVYGAMANRVTVDPRQAAGALHRASLRARAEHPDSPSLWAAHVHVGA